MLTERFDAALALAARLHRTQLRKNTQTPYLGHLLAVAALVIEDGGSEDEAIAALLHDAIEDQAAHFPGGRTGLRAYIRKQFGPLVAEVVDACTDDEGFDKEKPGTAEEKRENWLRRKRAYIESIAHETPETIRVTTADKIHNVESMVYAHAAIGQALWERFKSKSRDDQIAVYERLLKAIAERNSAFPPDKRTGLVGRLRRDLDLLQKLA